MNGRALVNLFLLLCAGCVWAQPSPPTVVSLDARVLNAEFVVACKIVKVQTTRPASQGSNVDVAVSTHLKGDVSPVSQFMIKASKEQLDDWCAKGTRLLAIDGAEPIVLDDPKLRVFTADMRILTRPSDVVEAAQKAIRTHRGVIRITTLSINLAPGIVKANKLAWDLRIVVPADDDIEKWAQTQFDRHSGMDRYDGLQALRFFPSPENARRLKKILAEPETKENVYARDLARSTLETWGELAPGH